MNKPPIINPVEMTEKEIELCKVAANRLGYTQTAYTSTSELWGLFCLRDSDNDQKPSGCLIKTQEFGILFVSTLEDLQLNDLAEQEGKMSV